jgi:hypothetical protein
LSQAIRVVVDPSGIGDTIALEEDHGVALD